MSKKRTLMIVGGVVVVAAAAVFAASVLMGGEKEVQVAEVPPVIEAEKPALRTIELSSEVIGSIEPASIVYVTPKGAGEITAVNVQAGDYVQAGDLICVIDTKQVDAAKISVDTAKISYDEAKTNLDRYSVLHAAGDMADADFESLKDKVEMARLQYEGAKLAYDLQLESSRVTAPISGKLENCNVKVHDMVSQQSQICVIAGEGGKAVTFYASERIVGGLNVGDALKVVKGGTSHDASVTEVSTMVDPASGLFKVKASISEGDTLATGTSVKAVVTSRKAENVLTVPVDSVYYEGGAAKVYTYENGELHKKDVTTGLADSEYIEIKEGLNASDLVLTTWSTELYDGSRVTLMDEAAAPSADAEDKESSSESEQ